MSTIFNFVLFVQTCTDIFNLSKQYQPENIVVIGEKINFGNHEAWVLMVCYDSPKTCRTVLLRLFVHVYPHAKFQVIPLSNVKDIRDFPIWKFVVNH